jgi:hypothetical protein
MLPHASDHDKLPHMSDLRSGVAREHMYAHMLRTACAELEADPTRALTPELRWFVDLARRVVALADARDSSSDDEEAPPADEDTRVAALDVRLAIADDDARPALLARKAEALCTAGRYAETVCVATESLDGFPDSVRALRARGIAFEATARAADAVSDLGRAQSVDFDVDVDVVHRRAMRALLDAPHPPASRGPSSPSHPSPPPRASLRGFDLQQALSDPSVMQAAQQIFSNPEAMSAFMGSGAMQHAVRAFEATVDAEKTG